MFTLTEDFLHCTLSKYRSFIRRAFESIPESVIDAARSVLLIPLIAPEDLGRIKSAHGAMYACRNVVRSALASKAKRVEAYDKPSLLREAEANREHSVVLLVDDFIGSGETAVKAVNDYNANWRVESDNAIVFALVAQEAGLAQLSSLRVSTAVGETRKRGITDSTRLPNISDALRIMNALEQRLQVQPEFELGYRRSESLVCMDRCPNNTFPVFWTSKRVEGVSWPAPFER